MRHPFAQMRLAPKCQRWGTLRVLWSRGELPATAPRSSPQHWGEVKPPHRGMAPIAWADLGAGLTLELVSPAKASCHLEAEAHQEWLGWAQRRERPFPLNTPQPPGQPSGAQHRCWGCCRAQGVPAREEQDVCPPKRTLETASISASSSGTLENTLSALCT